MTMTATLTSLSSSRPAVPRGSSSLRSARVVPVPRYPVQRHLDEAPPDSVGKAHVAIAKVSQREDPKEGVVCVVVTPDGRDRPPQVAAVAFVSIVIVIAVIDAVSVAAAVATFS